MTIVQEPEPFKELKMICRLSNTSLDSLENSYQLIFRNIFQKIKSAPFLRCVRQHLWTQFLFPISSLIVFSNTMLQDKQYNNSL